MTDREPMDLTDAENVAILINHISSTMTSEEFVAWDKTPEGRKVTNAIDRLGDRSAAARMRAANEKRTRV